MDDQRAGIDVGPLENLISDGNFIYSEYYVPDVKKRRRSLVLHAASPKRIKNLRSATI